MLSAFLALNAHCLTLEINGFRRYEAKIEESEKAGSHWESNQDTSHLNRQFLPLSHDSWTTTNPHNPLYVLHRWYWMPQSHTCRTHYLRLITCKSNTCFGVHLTVIRIYHLQFCIPIEQFWDPCFIFPVVMEYCVMFSFTIHIPCNAHCHLPPPKTAKLHEPFLLSHFRN